MVSDLCILDKVGWKEAGIGNLPPLSAIDSAVGGKKWEEKKGGGDIGARWEGSLANHPSHSPPPIALHIKLSFNPASSLSRNLGFNRAGAPRASTIALNSLELKLKWTGRTLAASARRARFK